MKNTLVLFLFAMFLLAFSSCQKEEISELQNDPELSTEQTAIQDFDQMSFELNAIKGSGQSSKNCIQIEDEGAATLGVHAFPNYPGSDLESCYDGMLCGWGALPFHTELADGIEGYMASIVVGQRYTGNELHGGATHYKLIHYFIDTEGDEFWTNDKAVCNPFTPGQEIDLDCIVNDQMTIVNGTGKFCNAYGKIFNHGVIDLAANEVVFQIKGRLCSNCMYE